MVSAFRGELIILHALPEAYSRVWAPRPHGHTCTACENNATNGFLKRPYHFSQDVEKQLVPRFGPGTSTCVALFSVWFFFFFSKWKPFFFHMEDIPLQKPVARQWELLISKTPSSEAKSQSPDSTTLWDIPSACQDRGRERGYRQRKVGYFCRRQFILFPDNKVIWDVRKPGKLQLCFWMSPSLQFLLSALGHCSHFSIGCNGESPSNYKDRN